MSHSLAPLAPAAARFGDAAAAVHPEQALFRLDLRRSLQLHGRLAWAIAVVGFLLAAAYLMWFWPIYSAQALLYIQPANTGAVTVGQPPAYPYDVGTYDALIQQQIVSMTRPDVLKAALGKLKPDNWQKSGESEQDAIDRLRNSLSILRLYNSYQVSITARAKNPQIAADMANAVAAAYIESTAHDQKAGDAQRMAILREDRDSVKKELAADRAEQAQLNAELGVAAIGAAPPEYYDEDIGKVHDELVKARADRDEAEAQLTALSNGKNSSAVTAETDAIVAADPGLTALKTALDQRRAALVTQMANLTPNHPLYKQDAAELKQIEANIDSATRDLRAKATTQVEEKLRTNLERAADVEASLNAELGQMARAAAGATPKLQRASDLAGDIARLGNRYDLLDQQMQNQMIQDTAPEMAHVTTAAVPPLHPTGKSVIRNSIALGIGFALLGMLAAVGAHKLDPHVYVASDVEQVLGFAPLAQLPDFAQVSDGVAGEHVLRLSAALEHARKQGKLKSCIFTATAPGAGATTVATRVRAVLEEIGRPAMLVDAMGTATASSSAAPAADTAAAGGRSLALLERLHEESKGGDEMLILTDTAPLTVSAETEYLARNADCVLVVMESGVTTRAQLRAAAGALQRLDVGSVGFVLNRIGLAKADPAFRNSVQAMENHLRLQNRSGSSRPVRTRRVQPEFAAPAQPGWEPQVRVPRVPEQQDREARAREAQLKEVREAQAREAQAKEAQAREAQLREAREAQFRASQVPAASGVEPAIRPPAAVPPRAPAVASAPLPPPRTAAPPQPVSDLAAAQPESDIPWWLADPALPPQKVAVPVPAQPARSREPQPSAAFEPVQAAPGGGESRLAGLRNLLFSRGAEAQPDLVEAPLRPAAPLPRTPAPEPRFTTPKPRVSEPPLTPVIQPSAPPYEPPIRDRGAAFVPFPDSGEEPETSTATEVFATPSSGSTRQVTTAPEFLPPRKTRKMRLEEEAAARRERRDTVDDIAILPSWRGQYRRKD